jgi:hypothetical protein
MSNSMTSVGIEYHLAMRAKHGPALKTGLQNLAMYYGNLWLL